MAVVTLTRGGTSVDIELVEEGGEQLLSTSFGKPEINVRDNGGTLNPRTQDQFSALENYELRGKLFNYATAHDLADLIKSASGTPLELQIPSDVYPDTVTVAPGAGQEGALGLSFPAGRRDLVDVSLSLTRVDPDAVFAANEQSAQTPRASGTGPVEVVTPRETIELPTADLSLERSVGRPNDVVRRQPQQSDPRYEVKAKVAADTFTFAFETVSDIPATLNALTDNIFRSRLGRRSVTVDFDGVLGLGEISAIPVGSSPFRQVHQSGQRWVTSPTLEFRRTFDVE
jgi:hypothetical protein